MGPDPRILIGIPSCHVEQEVMSESVTKSVYKPKSVRQVGAKITIALDKIEAPSKAMVSSSP
jgi:hypothetical protein